MIRQPRQGTRDHLQYNEETPTTDAREQPSGNPAHLGGATGTGSNIMPMTAGRRRWQQTLRAKIEHPRPEHDQKMPNRSLDCRDVAPEADGGRGTGPRIVFSSSSGVAVASQRREPYLRPLFPRPPPSHERCHIGLPPGLGPPPPLSTRRPNALAIEHAVVSAGSGILHLRHSPRKASNPVNLEWLEIWGGWNRFVQGPANPR